MILILRLYIPINIKWEYYRPIALDLAKAFDTFNHQIVIIQITALW